MSNKWIRELLSFTKKERTGIVSLLLIIFLLILSGMVIPFFIPQDKPDFSKWEAEVNTYLTTDQDKTFPAKVLKPVAIDPNKVDSLCLVSMGLPEKVVANWMKYLKKGGIFKDKEGVKKIFGMTPELYAQLDSFLIFRVKPAANNRQAGSVAKIDAAERLTRDSNPVPFFKKKEKPGEMILDLNSTDSINLVRIPGIGPVLASRIIRYRNLLGGYYAVSQLKEVYGLREENFRMAFSFFRIESAVLKTFNVNYATLKELGRHPYIGYQTARKLLLLRERRGKFSTPGDLSAVITADSLSRLAPYLKFTQ
jgi:competence protein ComEA